MPVLAAPVLGMAAGMALPAPAFGQSAPAPLRNVAPNTITPETLAPEHRDNGFRVEIPQGGALAAPKGAENLTTTLGEARLEGGFKEVARETAPVLARLTGHRVTLAEIYAAASEIEAIHARAGYVLARVSVPPQDLREGGPLRIVVIDGFIEKVDVQGIPARVRSYIWRTAGALQGRGHLTMRAIEQALMIANDAPGLTLRSTLARGEQPGGTRLVLEGSQRPIGIELGADNQYDGSLGTYGVHAELALNSVLGQGETLYGFVASHYDVTRLFAEGSPAAIGGGGMVLPIGDGRLVINPEATVSRTRPAPVPGAPQTVGLLRRLSLRANYALVHTREQNGGLSLTVEQIDEVNKAPDFGIELSHDRYVAVRVGASWAQAPLTGGGWGVSLRVSQGLGNIGAITLDDAFAAGVPFSRIGAGNSFTHLNAQARVTVPVGKVANINAQVRAQTSFGTALFRSEQFSLEGSDGLSAYIGGGTTVDEGAVARFELSPNRPWASHGLVAMPYLFAAAGSGSIALPTLLEPGGITAESFGAGARASLAGGHISVSFEYARGVSSYAPLSGVDRLNFTVGIHM